MSSRNAYTGSRRKLVLAFDIGTTYSGISYSVLDPGQMPVIKGVTRYPAQEQISGAAKIPTIIYYDRAGKVRAVGAEATWEGIYEEAKDGEWFKSERFNLRLRSEHGAGKNITKIIPLLPPKKSVIQVFADFLLYLLECASSYIQETHENGEGLWKSIQDDIDFVLSHPNGWGSKEQSQMRQAAVWAKLIPDTTIGHARLSFVTEGEANLHFTIQSDSIIKEGEGVVVVDAGDDTINISSYKKTDQEHTYEEVAPPSQCHSHGSTFVSTCARIYLSKFLSESKFLNDLDTIVKSFDKTTKVRFRSENDPQYIKFGSLRDNDPHCNIRFGQLKLSGSDVASFFKPSVDCIVNAVLEQKKSSHHPISHIVLVGEFATIDWLFHMVERSISKHGFTVLRPENHINKAVSDGAISFYLDHFVRTRVSKFTFGSFCAIDYDETDEEHKKRAGKRIFFSSGDVMIDGYFGVILPKNVQVTEEKEFRYPLSEEADSKAKFKDVTAQIWCYRGDNQNPRWKDVDTSNYTHLCTIITDLSHLPLKKKFSSSRKPFYQVYFDVIIRFGLTEMKAQVAWKHKDVEKRGPAKIVYDPVYLDTTDVLDTKKSTDLPTDAQKNRDLAKGSVNQVHVVSSARQKKVTVGWQGNSKADFDFGLAGLFGDPESQSDTVSSVAQSSVVVGLEGSSEANHDSGIQGLSREIAKNLQIHGNGNNIYFILQNYEKQTIIGDNYNDPGRQGDTFTGMINNAAVGGRENSNRLVNKGKR